MSVSGQYSQFARDERPGLARLRLAAAAEFRTVDGARTRVTLDRMAGLLCSWTSKEAAGRGAGSHDAGREPPANGRDLAQL